MKWILLLVPSICFARDFDLIYRLEQGRKYSAVRFHVDAESFPEAIRKGGDLCYEALVSREPITEDFKLRLTSTCANPDWVNHPSSY